MSQSDRPQRIAHGVGESARAARAAVGQAASQAVESGKRHLGDFGRSVSDQAQQLKERGKQGVEIAHNAMRENVVVSTLVAFGLGFLLAGLLLRKRPG